MRAAVKSDLMYLRQRRITLPWRLAFICYALALEIGTHWPSLEIGPEVPATDKTIHLIAFGGATMLLFLTRWVRSVWLTGLIVFCWSMLDELSQNIPGLGRTSHWHDMLANALGILVACAWLWAMKPVGVRHKESDEGPNRLRLRSLAFVIEEMFADWRAWAAAGIGAMTGALPVAVGLLLFMESGAVRVANIMGIALASGLTLVMWSMLWHQKLEWCLQHDPCVNCGAATIDETGAAIDSLARERRQTCPTCGATINPGQWLQAHSPSLHVLVRYSGRAAIVGIVALVIGFGLILVSPVLYSMILDQGPNSGSAKGAVRAVHSIGRLPPELVSTIDLSLYLLLFAVVARVYRSQLARFYDQAVRCLRCGHDLRGTPSENGIGHCGECGAAFVRGSR